MPNPKIQIRLWLRILLIAACNLAILAAVTIVFLRAQLNPELESFLLAGARERIASITADVAEDLRTAAPSERNAVLEKHAASSGITLLLYRNTGEQIAGPRTALPREVDVLMPRPGPPPPPRTPPPESRGESSGRREGPDALQDEGSRPSPPPSDAGGPPPRRGPPPGPPPGGAQQPSAAGALFLTVTQNSPMKYWIGVRMPLIVTTDGESLRSVLMFASRSFFTNAFFFDFGPWAAVAGAGLVISIMCWAPFVRNLTRSIGEMTRATARIADGRFDVELEARRKDELGSLSASINGMADRLKTLTDGRKRFLGAAAHELRSPIARMQLATEILARRASPEDQRYIEDLREDLVMMSTMTDELLQFTNAEMVSAPVKLSSVNVAETVRAAVRRESVEGANIEVDVAPDLSVLAHPEYLTRALSNIVRNALRYAAKDGPIRIRATAEKNDKSEGRMVRISVADCGPGVPEEELDRIFAPFYRLEDSRDRQSGGTGMGLAIVRSCIEACGGKVVCQNRQPRGLEVVILLPQAQGS